MKLRPTIFLSGVSSEFASFRDAVEIEIQKKGCFAENQSSFGVDYHTVEEMLRRRISDADAVIHIVGFRFGAEPKDRPADKPRRSYTQMEYDIARELEKPVYVFLSSDASVCDASSPDDDSEVSALQLAHRQAIKSTNHLRYTFIDKNELRHLTAEIDVVAQTDFRVDISRIDRYAPGELIGREDELALLNDAWLKVRRAEANRPHVLTFVALGGEGKTSLVAKWLADLAFQNWPGCDSAFAWSFYSQGTREQYAGSSDLFLKEAISFFGNDADKEFAASPAGAYEKGQRLARIVAQRRTLLILDGLEPLQYAPTSPTPGELKDGGIAVLLKSLAAHSAGLCIVTTRYSLPNLRTFWQTTAPEITLPRLSKTAGIHLLKTLGVKGSAEEFETLVEDIKGHALTLNLLGTYLRNAHGGDIRRRDLVRLEEANAEEHGGHAFRVMQAYELAFKKEGITGERALAVLRLLGLFDRPLTADCLGALLMGRHIKGLTEPLFARDNKLLRVLFPSYTLSESKLNITLQRLDDAKLLTVNRAPSGCLISLDTHPLVREYFATQLRTKQPKAWRAAHRRLYEYLYLTTPDKHEATLEDLQPLYQAVAHGCHAGLHFQVYQSVYFDRIKRGNEYYSVRRLGAFATDLAAIGYFFDEPWKRVSSAMPKEKKSLLLSQASSYMRALGRLTEAIEAVETALELRDGRNHLQNVAIEVANLSELKLALGKIDDALKYGEQSLKHAQRSADLAEVVAAYATYGHILHQAGSRAEAETCFREAQEIHKQDQPKIPLLYSASGFRFCDLILTAAEDAAWRLTLEFDECRKIDEKAAHSKALRLASMYAAQVLEWEQQMPIAPLLDFAFHRLTLCRSSLYDVVLSTMALQADKVNSLSEIPIDVTLDTFRAAGQMDVLPTALLTRAWLGFLAGTHVGQESAQEDLNEAWEIAERGPMRLHMADIHLYRARLFFREEVYPWESPGADLKAARKLIEQCGYWRRKEELEDAERVILKKSV